jgi:hopanoid biosynthesis associated RND transporter like protein HpnN
VSDGPHDRVERWLLGWSRVVRGRARLIVGLTPVVTALLGWYAAATLRVDTDTSRMVSDELEFRRVFADYQAAFAGSADPEFVVIIDGSTPALADRAAKLLVEAIGADPMFASVHADGVGEFWDRHGLMYMPADSLERLVDRVEEAAPLLRDLEADPTLAGLADGISGAPDDLDLAPVLGLLAAAAYGASEGSFSPAPWSALFQGRAPDASESRRTVTVRPRLEFENRVPGREATDRVREMARDLGLSERTGVRIRLTGTVAIESEEIVDAVDGVAQSGFLALLLVSLFLFLALRSGRMIAAALITLAAGLVATAAAAALLVGSLNLISVAFAVLYIGLGIDYAIHLCLRYAARRSGGLDEAAAVDAAVSEVGSSLALSALTTAACFLAFVPTRFTGVSELGIIGAAGMLVSFLATITVLPALLVVFAPAAETLPPAGGLPGLGRWVSRWRRPIVLGTLAFSLVMLAGLPRARFDHNALNLRDPASESVVTYRELLADPQAKPLTVSVLRSDSGSVVDVAESVASLDVADGTRSVFDFVPDDQERKLALLHRMAGILTVDAVRGPGPDVEFAVASDPPLERLIGTLHDLRWRGSDDEVAVARALFHLLRRWERRVADWPADSRAEHVDELERALLGSLTDQIARLRGAGGASSVTLEDLPEDLRSQWIGSGGRYRVDVLPAVPLIENEPLQAFVDGVRERLPDATGSAVSELETGRVAAAAFRSALGFAGLATIVLLSILQREVRVVLYVAGPLLLAAIWTAGLTGWLDTPFNFANVIALPLLLGVGVDNGIHMVHQARIGRTRHRDPMMASTSRAVLFATLTTMASFGNLAFAMHLGMASMGRLLTLGMSCVLIATLVLLPAIIPPTEKATEAG